MRVRKVMAIVCLLGLAGAASGQSAVNVHEVNKLGYDADLSTAPNVGVADDYSVVFGSHRMMLFDKAVAVDPTNPLSLLDDRTWVPYLGDGTGGYELPNPFTDPMPFTTAHASIGINGAYLTYPRADYDPIANTIWMVASESRELLFTGDPYFTFLS